MFKYNPDEIWGEGGYFGLNPTDSFDNYVNAIVFFNGEHRLINSDSSFVRVDFVTYNGHYNLFSYCYADFHIDPSGYVEPEL